MTSWVTQPKTDQDEQNNSSSTKNQTQAQTENNQVVEAAKNGGKTPSSTVSQILDPSGPVTLHEQQLVDYNNKLKGTPGTTTSEVVPDFNPRNVDEFLAMNPDAPETPEQRLQREKRERTNKIIAGVGDMISALANMYYTTKGAPSSYYPRNGMTPKMVERYDQLTKEREAREKEYRAGLQRARQLDNQQLLSWQQLKAQIKNHELQQKRLEQEAADRKEAREVQNQIARERFEWQKEANKEREERLKRNSTKKGSSNANNNGVKVVKRTDAQGKTTETRTYYEKPGATGNSSGNKWDKYEKK